MKTFFSGCPLGNVQATALKTCEKLTLGKMNCSTGLYHTPFTMVPVLMALKRAVTTASCKKKKSQAFILQAIGYVSISSTLNTTVQTVILKTSNLKGLHVYK